MRKSLEAVLTGKATKSGNYRRVETGHAVEFYLYTTVIGGYDSVGDIFFADNRGFGSVTTSRAVNDIKRYFDGSNEVTVEEFKKLTNTECVIGTWKN